MLVQPYPTPSVSKASRSEIRSRLAVVAAAYAIGLGMVTLAQLTLDRLPDRLKQTQSPTAPTSSIQRSLVRVASPLNTNFTPHAKVDSGTELEPR
jgi:hypothetical protein